MAGIPIEIIFMTKTFFFIYAKVIPNPSLRHYVGARTIVSVIHSVDHVQRLPVYQKTRKYFLIFFILCILKRSTIKDNKFIELK